MKVAITGASGFVGRNLTAALLKEGCSIISIDRSHGFDITDDKSLETVGDFDVLVHLAARSFVPDSYKVPHQFYNTNVTGTLNVLELTRKKGAKFLFISSYVYGHPAYLPIDEMHATEPFNPYAQSKIIGEELCWAYHRDFKVPLYILRPFNIYGWGQSEGFLIPKLISQVINDQSIELFDPRPKRDYVHVQDVVAAICQVIKLPYDQPEVFNIGSGESYSVEQLCLLLEKIHGTKLNIQYLHKYRPNEIMDTICNNIKARKVIGWAPTVSLSEGLKDMYEQEKLDKI